VTDGPATLYARAASAWTPIDWWRLDIDPAERARLEADMRTALDTLEARALVGADELARARSQPLGFLGMAMAPREDLAPKR